MAVPSLRGNRRQAAGQKIHTPDAEALANYPNLQERNGVNSMKSLAELQAIREKNKNVVGLRQEGEDIRVTVGMATCGIAAGARTVMNAFVEEAGKRGMGAVKVSMTGCAGMCRLEPIVEVRMPGQAKVTYVHMTPEKAARVVEEHLQNGKAVAEYTIENAE